MIKKLFIIVSLFLFALLTACASYPHVDSAIFGVKTDDMRVQVAFSDRDRQIIHDYYSKINKKQKGLPPGLAKKGKLPPGLQKQLAKNGKLPPGLAKRQLPDKLEEQLQPLPRGYARLKADGDIVLLNSKTEVIIDIIYDVE